MKNKQMMPLTKGVAKVPVVMQMEALECGAASLTMVMAYYGLWVPLTQVRKDCGVSRDGSKASNILKAARNYGFDAKGCRYEPAELKTEGKFPCIIHWNFNHFVVLDGFRGNKAYINDPAKGAYSVSMDQFDEAFTGICLFFVPTKEFRPGGKPASIMSFAGKKLKGSAVAMAFVILTTTITSVMGIINPVFSRIFLDRLLTGKNPEWFYPLIGAMSVAAIIMIIMEWIQAVYSLKINGKLAITANTEFFWHVLRMPMEFFSQRLAGDISMIQQENESIANTFIQTFAPLALNTAMMVFYLVAMLRYSPLLTLAGICSILINAGVSQLISGKRINITRVQMRDAGKLAGTTVAGIEMIETIKASGAENGFFEKWAGYQASVNNAEVEYDKLYNHLGLIPEIVSSLTDTVILLLGVYLTMTGNFTIGMIMAFQGFLQGFMAPAQSLVSASQTIQEMRTRMERVQDIMDYPSDVDVQELEENVEYGKLSGDMEMKDVTFGYSRLEPPLIEHFSMHIRQGQKIAFVGASGCGKSTLAKLISGLYKPWSGEILFDGKPLPKINRSVFTGSVAAVDQDIILFEDTIAENIRMWDSSIEDFEVIMAARDAKLHEDIMQREGGYDYRLTEGGRDLSGGQRQRLEIARVLAQDPTLMIMDEATSALDAKTEYEVIRTIQDRGITQIVIAHRLSTIRDCDEIIVMDKGKVVERGTHDELYRKGGLYTALVSNE
ncbi:MAG: NHLP family bacteriocin export ABC transporter peptidase/permease/ATPase subunit [Butyrivibrio sp.]|jgi:NHLM bacteriocin system ABC transporter peptidase/ATP-binding protein|nr:NHLP family bacteriocin export ABC transporter peptidase/permease/ATPase subunit [Butyrivibrio sp.]